jgi:hypothetical protein
MPASPILALLPALLEQIARLGDGAVSRRMKIRISVSFGILQELAPSPNIEVIESRFRLRRRHGRRLMGGVT